MKIANILKKVTFSGRQGFTLIELLLVMAIIGILAGAIMAGVSGQREKARATSALESLRSVMPYVVECYMKGSDVPANPDSNGGTGVCSISPAEFPALPDNCFYAGGTSNSVLKVMCGSGAFQKIITCNYSTGGGGNCILN